MEDLPILQRADASKRFEKYLYWGFVAILAGALATDHHWTERVMLLTESIS